MSVSVARTAEIKTRTTPDVKEGAKNTFLHWGLSLSDAINIFLVKSIEVGGLPFEMSRNNIDYASIRERAYHPNFDSNGVAILPSDWDDNE
jgi:DNA-damage-inducible protein J